MIFDKLFTAVAQMRNPSVLGLDTRLEYLPAEMLAGFDPADPFASAGELIYRFNAGLLDALRDILPCVKLQVAFYEMYGHHGLKAYADSIAYAKKLGYIVIADAKRNDIGSTAAAYAQAFLGSTGFPDGVARPALGADILTVTGYLGEDGILPFVQQCRERGKGIFVLVKTSNPSSGQLQDRLIDGQPVYRVMAELVNGWGEGLRGKSGYSAVGAVVGATYPQQGAELRDAYPAMPFLLPGYGAQGAKGADLALCFDSQGLGGVVNASRSIICAHQKKTGLSYTDAAREAAIAMREDLLAALAQAGRLDY